MNKKILLIGLVFLLMLSSAFATDFTVNNEGWWTLQTSDSVGIVDQSPNGNDVTIYGDVYYDATKTAFEFDGVGDYLLSNTSILTTGDKAVSFWFESDDVTSFTTIIDTHTSQTGDTGGVAIYTVSGNLNCNVGNGATTGNYLQVSTAVSINTEYHVLCVQVSNVLKLYIDGSLVATDSTTIGSEAGTNPHLVIGNSQRLTDEFNGHMSGVSTFSTSYDATEALELYDEGRDFNPYAVSPATDEVFPQVIEIEQENDVTINTNTYQTIQQNLFSVLNTTTGYTTWTVQVEALNKDTVATCRATINDTDYSSEKSRTLLTGETGTLYLYSDEFNLTVNETYDLKLQCKRDTTNGAKVTISEADGLVNIISNVEGTPINHEHGTATLTLNSTSYQLLGSQTFNTSSLNATGLILDLVIDGSMLYNYVNDATISIYASVNGTDTPIFERSGDAGDSGSGAGMSLTKNVSINDTVTIDFYGKSTSSDGNVTIKYTIFEHFAHEAESAINNLANTSISKTATWTTVSTLYVNNSVHTTSDLLIKASISASNSVGSCTNSFRLNNGVSSSEVYRASLNTAAGTKVTILQHVFQNQGLQNTSITLQTSNDCTFADSPYIEEGAFMGYIVDVVSSIPQFYTVQTRNEWDNVSITNFNVTLASGTLYQSNATGYVNIFHVNGLDTFTISAADYFNQTITNHNTSTNLTVDMLQSDITFNTTEIITNNTVAGNVTINGVTKLSTASFYLATGTYNATFSGTNYFDKTVLFSVSALDNVTINISGLSGTALNLTFRDFLTNSTQTGVTGYFSNNALGLNETFNTGTDFYTELSLLQGYDYNVTVVDDDYAITTTTYFVNASVVNETFYLYVTNSVNIFIRDEITRDLINDTTFTLEFVGNTNSFNASTSNGTYYVDLVTPDSYQLRYYSTSSSTYQLRAYTFDLTNQSFNEITLYAIESNASLVTTTFNVFSTALEPVEGARVILERFYIGDDGFSQVSSGSTNVDGVYIDFVEAVNAFYRYKVLYNGEIKYESPSQGTQFSIDTNLNIYIELFADNYEEYEQIFNIPTTITYTNLTNYTGYFDFSYTNPNLYQLCFEVYINNTDTTVSCPTVSASGSVQIPVSVTENGRSVAIASAKAYSNNVNGYVEYDSKIETFYPSSDFTQDYTDLFNLGLSIILTIVALVFIRFPVINIFIQTFVLVLFALIPLPFYTISIVTIGWIVSFNLIILWIVKKEGVPQ